MQYNPQQQQPMYPAPPQYPPQPVQQGYPIQQYPRQNAPAPYYPPQPQMTPEEYQQQSYKRSLRRAANGVGALMLIFFALELIISLVAEVILMAAGMEEELSDMSALFLLENGVVSSIVFFVSGLIYVLITKKRFSSLFPFDRIGGGYLAKLCVIGLAFSLMSNYVVDLVNNTFSLFGIENSGGSIDAGSNPNILIYFLTVAILPAFAEEFAFRGIVMGTLRPYSEGLAILISSAAFALMHGNFVQLPFTFCCGLVFAFIDIKTNSLLPSIIVHFLNNGLSVLADVLMSYEILSENMVNVMYGGIFCVTGILSFIFLKGIIKADDGSTFRLKGGNDIIPFKSKIKTAVSSPTLISFAVVMFLYCVVALIVT